MALKLPNFFVWGERGVQIVVNTVFPMDHAHVTRQMLVNWVLSAGAKEDLLMTAEMVVGSTFVDDCAVLWWIQLLSGERGFL